MLHAVPRKDLSIDGFFVNVPINKSVLFTKSITINQSIYIWVEEWVDLAWVEDLYHLIMGAFFSWENEIYNFILEALSSSRHHVGFVTMYKKMIARLALAHVLNRVATAVT